MARYIQLFQYPQDTTKRCLRNQLPGCWSCGLPSGWWLSTRDGARYSNGRNQTDRRRFKARKFVPGTESTFWLVLSRSGHWTRMNSQILFRMFFQALYDLWLIVTSLSATRMKKNIAPMLFWTLQWIRGTFNWLYPLSEVMDYDRLRYTAFASAESGNSRLCGIH